MEEKTSGVRTSEPARCAVGLDLPGDRVPISEKGIREIDRKIQDILGLRGCPGYTVEPMFPGVRTAMLYEKGSLSSATLLEPTHRGVDVTRHVKTILSVPLGLSPLHSGMTVPALLQVWGTVYRETGTRGGSPNSGPRADPAHGVMDILLQPDLRHTAREPLNFFCNGLFLTGELQDQLAARTHYETMLVLQGLGLRVNRPHLRVCREIAEVIDYTFELKQDPARFPSEISGALVTLNPLEGISRPEGATTWTPTWIIAFESCGS